MVTSDGKSDTKIKRRIGIAKTVQEDGKAINIKKCIFGNQDKTSKVLCLVNIIVWV